MHKPEDNQHSGVGGQTTEQRSQRKTEYAQLKEPFASVQVAQSPSCDEQHRIAESITGNDQLNLREGAVQTPLYRGDADIHHKHVQRPHKGADENDE